MREVVSPSGIQATLSIGVGKDAETLAELFQYAALSVEMALSRGANTKGKVGLFEHANHGTLMLDEIGDMPMDLQVKLLRAIQSQEITRIGGTRPIKLDIRFLALTNADLKKKVAEGSFRQDLYYRQRRPRAAHAAGTNAGAAGAVFLRAP